MKEKLLIRFQKKSRNSNVDSEANDELCTTKVISGESEEMCADRVRLKDRILEGVSKAVKEVCPKVPNSETFYSTLTSLHVLQRMSTQMHNWTGCQNSL